MKAYPIWQMKYCTKSVLVDTAKVSRDKVYIYFVADRNYQDLYSFDGAKVRNECKLIHNGKIYCFDVPLEMLVNEGELPSELKARREAEYQKFLDYKEKNKKQS